MVYSSNSGNATATDMITTLKNWADINGADALIQIGETTATVRQVCTPSCDDSGSGGAIARAFFGGLIEGTILVAIPVVIVWLVITFSTGTTKISSSYFKLLIMTKQHVYKNGNTGADFLTNALCILSWTRAVWHSIFTYKFEQNLEWKAMQRLRLLCTIL